jgi:hypothetical protein
MGAKSLCTAGELQISPLRYASVEMTIPFVDKSRRFHEGSAELQTLGFARHRLFGYGLR